MIRFFEFLRNHPVGRYIYSLFFGCRNHIEEQTLDFRVMSACQVFLHGSGAFGVEFINHFQIIADGVFREFNAQFLSESGAFRRKSDKCIPYLSRFLHFSHRNIVVSTRYRHCGDERPFDERIPVDVR